MIKALLEKLTMDNMTPDNLCVAFRLGGCRDNKGNFPECFGCKFNVGGGYRALIKELEAHQLLVEAVMYRRDDGMDGDMLCGIASHLLTLADKVEHPGNPYIQYLRDCADKLYKKHELQEEALAALLPTDTPQSKDAAHDPAK